ncbi:MAG: diacylglycerol kinase family lipid kinase [Candidatus Electrothrix sp. AUS3]|nr:diacylglycerol kinase family lipid kinase [Candidatus Electrothrix gigas]
MPVQRIIIVVNPCGGKRRGLAVLETVKPIFSAAGIELDVHVTTHAGHATELAGTLDFDGCDGFCLIGGDGTLHEAVCGLIKRDHPVNIPLGVIPGGTGNSVLQHFNCLDPLEAARRIIDGRTQPLDVARVMTDGDVTYCVNIIGWGAVADINRTAERLRMLGPPRYATAAIMHIVRLKKRRARLVLDGRIFHDAFLFITACNTRFTGKGMQLAPKADTGDGKLDIVLVRHATQLQMLKVFKKVFDGTHVSLPYVEYHQVHSFSIEQDGIDPLILDGELKGSTPVSVNIIPNLLKIFT